MQWALVVLGQFWERPGVQRNGTPGGGMVPAVVFLLQFDAFVIVPNHSGGRNIRRFVAE